jgi:hypothetical protein
MKRLLFREKMYKIVIAAFIAVLCSGCSSKTPPDLKSPCVAVEPAATSQKSDPAPCVRRRVNDNWLG